VQISATQIQQAKELIDRYEYITILTHINPDSDTIGTGLGIYSLLKQNTNKRVEIVNVSKDLPNYLDFLRYFDKFKKKMDFANSLIISVDSASSDRLGVDIDAKGVLNIDHHKSNTNYGSVNVVVPQYASASMVAFELFGEIYPISKDSAQAFYTALVSDSQFFTTSNVDETTFAYASKLMDLGADNLKVAYNLKMRKSLASVRILQKALASLQLRVNAKVATMQITQEDIKACGALMPDMETIVDYGRDIACVEISVLAIELENHTKVSLRSKNVDISTIAKSFGGGGHANASGFEVDKSSAKDIIDKIIDTINKIGLING
jgi:phosphoesterase RecJ-like protein